eukprot:TRINITY_DN4309_c2_g1_i5.p1 TRINITY_DN4309_c2_g1~~TRINITY_DN4309_c2_g1_i5.p1  ORF type:complete len:146 (-),score=22.80 TRINITY_DN4309_c2_g1_i5:45-482(-)
MVMDTPMIAVFCVALEPTLVPCQACNATLTCNRGADVTIDKNYWPNINASTGAVEGLLCPFAFCDTGNTTGNIFDLAAVCNPALNRNGSSTLCGECFRDTANGLMNVYPAMVLMAAPLWYNCCSLLALFCFSACSVKAVVAQQGL